MKAESNASKDPKTVKVEGWRQSQLNKAERLKRMAYNVAKRDAQKEMNQQIKADTKGRVKEVGGAYFNAHSKQIMNRALGPLQVSRFGTFGFGGGIKPEGTASTYSTPESTNTDYAQIQNIQVTSSMIPAVGNFDDLRARLAQLLATATATLPAGYIRVSDLPPSPTATLPSPVASIRAAIASIIPRTSQHIHFTHSYRLSCSGSTGNCGSAATTNFYSYNITTNFTITTNNFSNFKSFC